MFHTFYKLGALQACADAGLTKVAILGEVIQGAPSIAKAYAKTKLIGEIKGDMREALGLPTPQWREAGGLYEIPAVAAGKVKEQIEEALKPEEPEPVKLPVVKLDLPPKETKTT